MSRNDNESAEVKNTARSNYALYLQQFKGCLVVLVDVACRFQLWIDAKCQGPRPTFASVVLRVVATP
jgi:hypothetical protein